MSASSSLNTALLSLDDTPSSSATALAGAPSKTTTSISSSSLFSASASASLPFDEIDLGPFIEHQKIIHGLLRAKNLLKSTSLSADENKYENLINRIDSVMKLPVFNILTHGNLTNMQAEAIATKESSQRRNAQNHLRMLSEYVKSHPDYLSPISTLNKEALDAIYGEPYFRTTPEEPISPENPIHSSVTEFLNPARTSTISMDEISTWLRVGLFDCEDGERTKKRGDRIFSSEYIEFPLRNKLFYILHQGSSHLIVRLDDPVSTPGKFFVDFYIVTLDTCHRPIAISSILKQPRNTPETDMLDLDEKLSLFFVDPYWIAYQPLTYQPATASDLSESKDFIVNSNALQLYQIEMNSSGRMAFQPVGRSLYFPNFHGEIQRFTLENDDRLFFTASINQIQETRCFQVIEIQTFHESIQLVPHFFFTPQYEFSTYKISHGMFISMKRDSVYLEDLASGNFTGLEIYHDDSSIHNLIFKSYGSNVSIYKRLPDNKEIFINSPPMPMTVLRYNSAFLPDSVSTLFPKEIHALIREYYNSSDLHDLLRLPRELQEICRAITVLFLNDESSFQIATLSMRLNLDRDTRDYSNEIKDFFAITNIMTTLHQNILNNPRDFAEHVESARKSIIPFVGLDSESLPDRANKAFDSLYYSKLKDFFHFTLVPLANRYRNHIPLLPHEINILGIELLHSTIVAYLQINHKDMAEKNLKALYNSLQHAIYKLLSLQETASKEFKVALDSISTLLKRKSFLPYAINVLISACETDGFLLNRLLSITYHHRVVETLRDEIQAIKPHIFPEEGKRMFTPQNDRYGSVHASRERYSPGFSFSSTSSVPADIDDLQTLFNHMQKSKHDYPEAKDKFIDQCKNALMIEMLRSKGMLEESKTNGIKIKNRPDVEIELRKLIKDPILFSTTQRGWIESQCPSLNRTPTSSSLSSSSSSTPRMGSC